MGVKCNTLSINLTQKNPRNTTGNSCPIVGEKLKRLQMVLEGYKLQKIATQKTALEKTSVRLLSWSTGSVIHNSEQKWTTQCMEGHSQVCNTNNNRNDWSHLHGPQVSKTKEKRVSKLSTTQDLKDFTTVEKHSIQSPAHFCFSIKWHSL